MSAAVCVVEQSVKRDAVSQALMDFVRALARRQARIDVAKLIPANDNLISSVP